MEKHDNQWEKPLTPYIKYLNWDGMVGGKVDYWETTYHNHAPAELHIILEGACTISVGDADISLRNGQGIIINSGVFHGPKRIEKPFQRISVTFVLESSLDSVLWGKRPDTYQIFEIGEEVRILCGMIEKEIRGVGIFQKERISLLFSDLMIHMMRSMETFREGNFSDHFCPKQFNEIGIIDDFFAVVPLELQTSEELARKLHCSERQLLRKLKKYYGVTFREKQIALRISRAKNLLRKTDFDMNAVSAAVGYSDCATFSRAFKRYTGITPMMYREKASSE